MRNFVHTGKETAYGIMTKFCLWVDIEDLITYATFGDDRLRGLGVARGRISHWLASSPLQHCHYRASVWLLSKYHLEGNAILAWYGHAHMLLYESGVNCNLNSNYTKYLAQLCSWFITFCKTYTANLRFLWRRLAM